MQYYTDFKLEEFLKVIWFKFPLKMEFRGIPEGRETKEGFCSNRDLRWYGAEL